MATRKPKTKAKRPQRRRASSDFIIDDMELPTGWAGPPSIKMIVKVIDARLVSGPNGTRLLALELRPPRKFRDHIGGRLTYRMQLPSKENPAAATHFKHVVCDVLGVELIPGTGGFGASALIGRSMEIGLACTVEVP